MVLPAEPVATRPDLQSQARRRLSFTERWVLALVRASFHPGLFSRLLTACQRGPGQSWIYAVTARLCAVRGLEQALALTLTPNATGGAGSVLVVANHRSFFDLYVITARLVRAGMKKRIVFPVRSSFFYDSWLGLLVNFFMSFLAMYPPLFREREKAPLNVLCLDELAWLLQRGGVFCGIHPEGARKQDASPYEFLPTQPGVGRIAHRARVPVVPVFVNGLGNNLFAQVWSGLTGRGARILVLYGEPVDLRDLLGEPGSPRIYKAIAERCMAAVGKLAEEEQAWRADVEGSATATAATAAATAATAARQARQKS